MREINAYQNHDVTSFPPARVAIISFKRQDQRMLSLNPVDPALGGNTEDLPALKIK